MTTLFPQPIREIAPGAVHVPGWLTLDEQQRLVEAYREWARPPAPLRATRMPNGSMMSVRTVCLGWHWQPYRYSRTADDVDGAVVKAVPQWLAEFGRRAVTDAYRDPAAGKAFRPDVALVNYYDDKAHMGLHQDKDERSRDPVVSLSVGDTGVFRFGNATNRGRPYQDITVESGDLFVFGGPSRMAYHGVQKILPGTGDPATGLGPGRLNITLRATGLED
jgi:DNA oxidative demethylase